jgi:hypothetical protein
VPSTAEDYNCNGLFEDGGEQVFILTLTDPTIVTGRINSGTFFNIYLLQDCNENTCIAWDSDEFTSGVLPPGIYYIVIDSVGTAAGPYEVEIICNTPTPTMTPTPTGTWFSPTPTPTGTWFSPTPSPTPSVTPTPTLTPSGTSGILFKDWGPK